MLKLKCGGPDKKARVGWHAGESGFALPIV